MSLTKVSFSMINGAPINALDYGVVGNGTTDDTAALNLAFATGKPVYIPNNCTCKITGALTATNAIYMGASSYIQPTGSGYTALTIVPVARTGPYRVIIGDGSTTFAGKGLVFGSPVLQGYTQMIIELFDVRNCTVGGGIEINNIFESIVQKISAYGCGDSSNYAVAINSNVGDSSNTTVFNNITIGQSDKNALYISAQFCQFPFIYVEEVYTPSAKFFWLKGCVKSAFGKIRIYNAGSAEAWIGTAQSTYDFIDSTCNITFDQTDIFGQEPVTINLLSNSATIGENSPAGGVTTINTIAILNGTLATLNTGAQSGSTYGGKWNVQNCNITTLNVGINAVGITTIGARTSIAADAVIFSNCKISSLSVAVVGNCSFTLDTCRVGTLGSNLSGYVKLNNAYIQDNLTIAGDNISSLNYQGKIFANETYFSGTFNTLGNVVGLLTNCTINGNMTATNGGTTALGLRFSNTGCNGTVASAFSNYPQISEVADSGVNLGQGATTDNIKATVGQPKNWICTVSGNPGTWVSGGNL